MKKIILSLITTILVSSNTVLAESPKVTQPAAYEKNWGYLISKLEEAGVPPAELLKVYGDKRIPAFAEVPYRLNPKESKRLYEEFNTKSNIAKARGYLANYRTSFAKAHAAFGVEPSVIAAVLLVETHLGENVGSNPILYRLSRAASVGEPANLEWNIKRIQLDDPHASKKSIRERAKYLEKTFLPEIVALFEIGRVQGLNILKLKGSVAGAFGLPQFLPSSFLRYAVDGNKNGVTSLFEVPDAIASVGHYLSNNGWHSEATLDEKKDALWTYNKSEAYIEAVLEIAAQLEPRRG